MIKYYENMDTDEKHPFCFLGNVILKCRKYETYYQILEVHDLLI